MKKLLLISIFAIAITTKASAFRDTLQINNNSGISAYCQHWTNGYPSGVQITTYTCNFKGIVFFGGGSRFMVNTTLFQVLSVVSFFNIKFCQQMFQVLL
ncbi:MAG: hypothetical protein IPH32_17380 [Bacteroidetes bacterium]|nr:hypothetical protein [Bacteroidota bacterium]